MEARKTGGRRLHNALSERAVRAAKAPGRYFDGQGLFLIVEPTGAKRWAQRLTVGGRRQELGLGGYPVVSLKMARDVAIQNRRTVREGENPKTARRRARGVPTFAEAARKVFELRKGAWKGTKHARDWVESMERHALPRLGDRGVDDVSAEDVLAVLAPIWHDKATTAKRVRQRIGAVLAWAVAQGLRSDNPADAVKAVLARQSGGSTPQRSLPYSEVSGAVATVRGSNATPAMKLAFAFMVLTAARPGEVREATWDEIDMVARTWTVPASRMKAGREHRVPLSDRALEGTCRCAPDRRRARVHLPESRPTHRQYRLRPSIAATRHRLHGTRLPGELPGMGAGADEHSARGLRGGPCTHPQGQGGSGLCAL